MTETVDQRRLELEAELAQLAEQERAAAEERRKQANQEAEAKLDPDQRARKAEIERRAQEALDREYPPAWLPQKQGNGHPAEVIGLVLRIDPRVGPSKTYGTYSAVIEVKTVEGQEWTIWANHEGALYSQMVRLRVQPGEVVAVRYRGLKESGTNPGQSYHDFRLVRVEEDEGPAAPVDYEALQHNRETPALPAPEQTQPPDDDIPF